MYKIYEGEIELYDVFNIMIDFTPGIVPLAWMEPCLDYHKD
jgi:hypothetical protein